MNEAQLAPYSVPGSKRLLERVRRAHARAWAQPGRSAARKRFAVAVMKLDRIGDFVLAVGAIRLICDRWGEEQCLLVVAPGVAELAARDFPRAERIALPAFPRHKWAWRDWRRARRALAGIECDELFCLRHQRWDFHELVLQWIRAGRRHVLEDPQAARWVAGRRSVKGPAPAFDGPVAPAECRELAMHRALLGMAFGREVTRNEIEPRFMHLVAGAAPGGIAVVPFGSAALRDFPEGLLVAALTAACEKTGGRPVMLYGDAGQRGRLVALAERLRARGIGSAACAAPTTVVQFAEAIAGAELVLTVESSGAHLATALDRPAVVLIGGGHFGQFGPWTRSARQVWVTHRMDCFECDWRCVLPAPYCITRVGESAVRSAVAAALNGGVGG